VRILLKDAYRRLVEAWSRELNNPELQDLEEDFYIVIRDYLGGLERLLEQKGSSDIEGMLRARELERARSIFIDLIKRRSMKIFESLMFSEMTPEESNLTMEEKNAVKHLQEFKKSLMETCGEMRPPPREDLRRREGGGREELLIRLLKPLPKITGLNLVNYGPFEAEDIATIPRDNVDVLIKRGVAVKVNWDTKRND